MRTTEYTYGFGNRLKEVLKEKGMTSAELERRINHKGKSMVYGYSVDHKMPTVYTLVKIATVLNVSTDWLLGLKKERGIHE